MDTRVLAQRNCAATSAMSSAFAFPSTGGDLSVASHVPSGAWTRVDSRAFGFTFTVRSVGTYFAAFAASGS